MTTEPLSSLTASSGPSPEICSPPFLSTLRGLWLMTWKTRCSLRQSPAILGTILPTALLTFFVLRHDFDEKTALFYWLSTAHLLLAVPLYCLAVFGGLIRDDLQSNTLGFLTTRPLSRARFLLSRFLCQLAWVQVLGLIAGLLFLATGQIHGASGLPRFAPLFLVTQALALFVFAGLATFLGLLHRRYLVLGTLYGLFVEVGIGQIPTNINTLAMTRHLRTILGRNPELASLYTWPTDALPLALAVLLMTPVVFLALSAALFTLREYLPSDDPAK